MQIEGELKITSSTSTNVFSVLLKNGQYLGELTISHLPTMERVEKIFKEYSVKRGELAHGDHHLKGGLKIPISMTFKDA